MDWRSWGSTRCISIDGRGTNAVDNVPSSTALIITSSRGAWEHNGGSRQSTYALAGFINGAIDRCITSFPHYHTATH